MNLEVKWKVGAPAAERIAEKAREFAATIALLSRTGSWVKATVAAEWAAQDLQAGSKVRLMIYGTDEENAVVGMRSLFAMAKAPRKGVGRTAKPS